MYPQSIENSIKKLFWSTPDHLWQNLSQEAIVEQILNFGNAQDVRALLNWLGIDVTASIFFKQISGKRNNYHKRTRNYFELYFARHASRNIDTAAT
jgi:hypothetical protein